MVPCWLALFPSFSSSVFFLSSNVYFFSNSLGLYKFLSFLLNTISGLTWIYTCACFKTASNLFNSMWIYSSLFVFFFFFFFVLSPGLWSLQVFCRSWIRYPGGCFAAQILNWVHWVLSSLFFFLVPNHELGKKKISSTGLSILDTYFCL